MTVAESRSADAAERLLWKAIIISVALHLAVFGGWKWGQKYIKWKGLPLPAWLEMTPPKAQTNVVVKVPVIPRHQPPPLIYVDVDPALVVAVPPTEAKYYSSANTMAANPEIKKPSDQPQITGTQDKVMQTLPTGVKAAPLQPSPPPDKKAETADKVSEEHKAAPKPAQAAGDLADAKPAKVTQEKKGTSDTEKGTDAMTEPKREKPRTLAEARARSGVPAPKMQQTGGASRIALDPSLDTQATLTGEYDGEMIETIRSKWYQLLEGRQDIATGKVVLAFNLHADGRVTDMKLEYSDVNELLSIICQQAVLDPAKYRRWPEKMRQEITDPRQIRFTFFYSN